MIILLLIASCGTAQTYAGRVAGVDWYEVPAGDTFAVRPDYRELRYERLADGGIGSGWSREERRFALDTGQVVLVHHYTFAGDSTTELYYVRDDRGRPVPPPDTINKLGTWQLYTYGSIASRRGNVVNVVQAGSAAHDPQIVNRGMTWQAGDSIYLSIQLRGNRDIILDLNTGQAGGWQKHLVQTLTLTDSWQTFRFAIQSQYSGTSHGLDLNLGGATGWVEVGAATLTGSKPGSLPEPGPPDTATCDTIYLTDTLISEVLIRDTVYWMQTDTIYRTLTHWDTVTLIQLDTLIQVRTDTLVQIDTLVQTELLTDTLYLTRTDTLYIEPNCPDCPDCPPIPPNPLPSADGVYVLIREGDQYLIRKID